jgi:GNAT superfamily N-acetyltransferase
MGIMLPPAMSDDVPRVRLATPADLPALRTLIPRSVRALSRSYYSDAQIEGAIEHVFGPDTQLIADRTYFVVEAGGAIVGCGGWSRRRTLYGGDQMKDGVDPLVDPATEPARIRAFFVDPDWARRGIGTRLLDACVGAARGAGFRRLELAATLPGEPLYRAFGFEPLERIEAPLPDGLGLPIVRMARAVEVE